MSPDELSLPDWLRRRAIMSPHAPAVSDEHEAWSFGDLEQRAITLAGCLAACGVKSGDHVAVLMGNGLPMVAVIHALIKVGAILVPLNCRLTPAELIWQVAYAHSALLLYDTRNRFIAAAVQAGISGLRCYGVEPEAGSPLLDDIVPLAFPARDRLELSATHCIIYTSGTTGRPKGVVLTYGNHWWSAIGSALNLGHHADDRWLAVLPLFHVGGLSILMRSVIYGIPATVHHRFDPLAVNAAIDREGVTIVSVVATMLQRMVDIRGDLPYPGSLRAVLLGGGPVPRSLLQRCVDRHIPIIQSYGMTESASQLVTISLADATRKLGSAGQPLLPVEVRIQEDGTLLPPGVPGEIIARGPNITHGYAGNPEATAQALRHGWLHTGDIGYLDAEGYLYVLDRRDDLIISGGENIYPAEVEAVLLAHPAVTEAGVIGLPDQGWGQRVAAAVVLDPASSVSSSDLIAFCHSRLAKYKVPVMIIAVPALPRNSTGKLLRRVLRERWGDLLPVA